jgi:hypothetical protein
MIRRTFNGLGELARFLERGAGLHEEAIAAVAAGSAVVLQERVRKTFGDSNKLASLEQATQDERTALGFSANDPLLRDGKLLRDSVERVHTRTAAGVGSAEKILMYHELGYVNKRTGKSVTPRPVFKIALVESAAEIEGMINEAIEFTLVGAKSSPLELKP